MKERAVAPNPETSVLGSLNHSNRRILLLKGVEPSPDFASVNALGGDCSAQLGFSVGLTVALALSTRLLPFAEVKFVHGKSSNRASKDNLFALERYFFLMEFGSDREDE